MLYLQTSVILVLFMLSYTIIKILNIIIKFIEYYK